ncbi:hypothetical protein KKA24_03470, partial [Patescibacteria group bacterium]|nr:hypothetical protein [Patescibacteria group bacterium]
TDDVYMQGKLYRNSADFGVLELSDGNKSVFINLKDSNISLIDAVHFWEKLSLEKGIINEIHK